MANHLNRVAVVIAASIICAGCVAIWQSDHSVAISNELAVAVDYDPLLMSPGSVSQAAQAECSKFQRRAVLEQIQQGKTWTKTANFRCEIEERPKGLVIASANSVGPASAPLYKSLPPPLPTASQQTETRLSAPYREILSKRPQTEQSTLDFSEVPSVRYIDAAGPNSGVIHRQIAKTQFHPVQPTKTKSNGEGRARTTGRSVAAAAPSVPKLPAPTLKRSLLS